MTNFIPQDMQKVLENAQNYKPFSNYAKLLVPLYELIGNIEEAKKKGKVHLDKENAVEFVRQFVAKIKKTAPLNHVIREFNVSRQQMEERGLDELVQTVDFLLQLIDNIKVLLKELDCRVAGIEKILRDAPKMEGVEKEICILDPARTEAFLKQSGNLAELAKAVAKMLEELNDKSAKFAVRMIQGK